MRREQGSRGRCVRLFFFFFFFFPLHVLRFPQSRRRRSLGDRCSAFVPVASLGSMMSSSSSCRRGGKMEKDCITMDVNEEEQQQGAQQSESQLRPPGKCPPPFLSKTYDLVDRPGAEHIVSWNREGTAFVVWLPEDLSQFLLPKYFKHCNFSSFIRQLNTYGFRKSAPDRWEFRHEKFQKGKAHLLGEITRRRCEPSFYPSFLKARGNEPMIEDSHLLEKNKILQQENSELLLQIAHYKALESELMKCLSQFKASNKRARLLS